MLRICGVLRDGFESIEGRLLCVLVALVPLLPVGVCEVYQCQLSI